MKELIAKKCWVGAEGRVMPGESVTPANKEREQELVDSGRAVYADQAKESKESKQEKEVKGGSRPEQASGKSAEPVETKKAPKRKRRTKVEIEADKANQEDK